MCRFRAVGLIGFNAEGMASWLQVLMRRRGALQIGKAHMGAVLFRVFLEPKQLPTRFCG